MTTLKPLEPPECATPISRFFRSSIGKKIVTGVTGLGMVAFLVIHMLGNLLLLASRERFNQYAVALEQMKPVVILVEIILVFFVAIHAFLGIQLFWRKRAARPDGYAEYQSAGVPSHQTWSSRHMIWTGLSLAAFLIWHLLTFKLGAQYTVMLAGVSVRDLAQLVIESFQQLWFTGIYGVLLAVLFLHLRHGIWSALQSTALLAPSRFPSIYLWCNGIAAMLWLGFMLPPIAILCGWVL